jgi:hypothetical protein
METDINALQASTSLVAPSGTKMVFYQASAPTGWTAVAVNDKFLRVVSAGGTGGTAGGSGLAPSSSITLAHTHTVASHTHTGPSHTHSISASGTHAHSLPNVGSDGNVADGGRYLSSTSNDGDHSHGGATGAQGTGNTGAASPATDSQLSSIGFQYTDVIVATKD